MASKIIGIQEAQAAMLRGVAALKPGGAFGNMIREVTTRAHRYAASITHVDTGALRASHTAEVSGLHGVIYIAPGATRSDGGRPAEYGLIEHARGGAHAFYERTAAVGQRIVQESQSALTQGMP
jgi:hypothetical protein